MARLNKRNWGVVEARVYGPLGLLFFRIKEPYFWRGFVMNTFKIIQGRIYAKLKKTDFENFNIREGNLVYTTWTEAVITRV